MTSQSHPHPGNTDALKQAIRNALTEPVACLTDERIDRILAAIAPHYATAVPVRGEDAERLDAIEKNNWEVVSLEGAFWVRGFLHFGAKPTLRAAIDAARQSAAGKGEGGV